MEFEPVIGLEVHTQLKTNTKMFCHCKIVDSNSPANTSICPVCTGQPGALPLPNKKAVEMAIKIGIALNCKINLFSVFARKNYFYPDLPKGYQISQYELPLCENGFIEINKTKIRIKRAHLEEDAAKSLHAIGSEKLNYTLIDFNRCGVPLVEIVSEADITSPEMAYDYLVELKKILRWIDVSDCDMEKGELRCDVNISLREKGSKGYGSKVEIKNLNSFKSVKDALIWEIKRQSEVLSSNKKVDQDTRLWDANRQMTIPMRTKEMANDYRYFPDPDLVPIELSSQMIEEIAKTIGPLPYQIKADYINRFNLKEDDLEVITSIKELNSYFLEITKLSCERPLLKNALNLINTQLLFYINENKIKEEDFDKELPPPSFIYEIAKMLTLNEISQTAAKKVFEEMIKTRENPALIVERHNLKQTNDIQEIEKWVSEAIELNKKAFEDFKNGNEKATGPIVGYVMKKSRGKANPRIIIELLEKYKS